MKNSAKEVKHLGFLNWEYVWRMPTFFSKIGKTNSDPVYISPDRQTCTILGLDSNLGTNQVKENNPDFPSDCLFDVQEYSIAQLKQAGVQQVCRVGMVLVLLKCQFIFFSIDKSLTALRNVSPSVCITFIRKTVK